MRAIVIGGAENVLADVSAALAMLRPDIVVAVNDGGVAYPGKVDHWVTLHPDELLERIERRRRAGYPLGFDTWGHEGPCDHIRCYWDGSSGLFGVKVAIELGAQRIVLAGIPMDQRPHVAGGRSHEFRKGKDWMRADDFRPAWTSRKAQLKNVRSMSGWTQTLLGVPTRAWLGT